MKISLISRSDYEGGAAKATYRLHNSLKKIGIQSELLVINQKISDSSIKSINRIQKVKNALALIVANKIVNFFASDNFGIKSLNVFGSNVLDLVDDETDVINIHWINQETLSLRELSRVKKNVVITLHDMWFFCGSEHYTESDYYMVENEGNRIAIDKLLIKLKKQCLSNKMTVVTPSQWLSSCARRSEIFENSEVYTIPNALDTKVFKKNSKIEARRILNLPSDEVIIGFGAIGGTHDKRKGFDELTLALKEIGLNDKFTCVVFGQHEPIEIKDIDCKFISFGIVNDEYTLSLLYNAFNVMVVPSRLEAFGQTASESICCGTPVVGFSGSGLDDIIEHKVDGYLALPYQPKDLAKGINWCLHQVNNDLLMGSSLSKAKYWSEESVASMYNDVYKRLINDD